MTEREKLNKGLWYDANYDKELLDQREKAEELYFLLNLTPPQQAEKREEILAKLLPNKGRDVSISPPFYTDYGFNCYISDHTFINHNAYLMDGAPIRIGSYCFIGPNCGMYTAQHPLLAKDRNKGLERARPITIGTSKDG